MVAASLALALVAAIAPAAGTVPGGGGALRFAAEPPALLLGRDAGADLRIAAPPEVEELTVSASAGRVEGVRRLPQGGFVARYRPPADRIPQVAIVAALARTAHGTLDGWLAIPLSGQGDARVRAEPGTRISLRVGDRQFGPKVADGDGLAVIPVVVPPGVREAHHGFRPVDLRVPETPLLHAQLDRTALVADRVEAVKVLAYVVAPHGAARRGDVPVFEPTRGAVSAFPREPGAFEATWTLGPGAAGEERLVVRLPGSPPSRTVLRVDVAVGAPATVAVAFDRGALVAGNAEAVRVTARALDAAGNAVSAPLELASDAGVVDILQREEPGRVEALLKVPPAFAGRREVTVTARSPSTGIAGARTLPLRAGAPVALRVTPADTLVTADGSSEARMRVVAVDRFDNPVSVEAPAVGAVVGTVREIARDGALAWTVAYRAPELAVRTEERIHVDASGLHAVAEWGLLPPRPPVSVLAAGLAAGDARGRFGAGGVALAVEHAVPWPRAFPALPAVTRASLRLELDGAAWTVDRVAPPGRGREAADAPTRLGLALAGATLARDLRAGPQVWGAVTAGVALVSVAPGDGPRETGFAPAARLSAAAGLPLRYGTPYLELSLLAAGKSPAGAFAAVGLAAGVKFDLGGAAWRRSSSSTTSR